jgi:hypothetical protein
MLSPARFVNPFQSRASGARQNPEAVTELGSPRGTSRNLNREDGVTEAFKVSGYVVKEPVR